MSHTWIHEDETLSIDSGINQNFYRIILFHDSWKRHNGPLLMVLDNGEQDLDFRFWSSEAQLGLIV